MHGLAVKRRLARHLQHERGGVLRDGVGAVGGDVRDDDAALLGSGHVNDVVPGGQDADVGELGERRLCLSGEGHLVGEEEPCALGTGQDVVVGGAVVDAKLAQRLEAGPADIAWVERVSVQDNDLVRHQASPWCLASPAVRAERARR